MLVYLLFCRGGYVFSRSGLGLMMSQCVINMDMVKSDLGRYRYIEKIDLGHSRLNPGMQDVTLLCSSCCFAFSILSLAAGNVRGLLSIDI